MKRIYRAIILVLFTLVSVTGFAADTPKVPKAPKVGKAGQPRSSQGAQIKFLKSLSYGDCVDYLKEEMKLTDSEANNRCGAVQ